MQIKSQYRYRIYFHGLVAAVLSGVSNSAVLMMVDRQDFNLFEGGLEKLASVAAASAVLSFFIYLKEHPLPSPLKDLDYYEVRSEKAEAVRVTAATGARPVKTTEEWR